MIQKPGTQKEPAEKVVKDIRRRTRQHHPAEEKIRIGPGCSAIMAAVTSPGSWPTGWPAGTWITFAVPRAIR
ncbi:hypothetical protein AB9K34_03525, partial [Sedimentitalea sp. XS_ASV28]|uniref:hypothetical protein n=1 Tax=Sedimentitalea sp. XS_ASV28 TaxID=3241296 RepID=UPI0035165F57